MVIHHKFDPHHPQANGQAESTNKVLCPTLTKVVEGSQCDWEQKLNNVMWVYRTAYKTSINSMPYELIFGLNAILPIDFLIPTLRVATSLGWTSHKLSDRVEELERLGERRQTAIMGIYAENHRQKEWYDSKVHTKEFQKGDLVLVFTLKKHAQKLKMRGLEPYVINEITFGGAVCLETLDGEPMANFINGSCLKHFHEPLTPKILEKMHAAMTRKLAIENMKKEAQEEARQRAAKAKARRHQISIVDTINTDEADYVPLMLLQVGIAQAKTTCSALLDSRVVVGSEFYGRTRL